MIIKCLKGGRVVDPVNKIDKEKDLYFGDGKILNFSDQTDSKDIEIIDVRGKIIFPGLIDLRTHLKYITSEKGENISSLTKAASAGGYTTIMLMCPIQIRKQITQEQFNMSRIELITKP